MLLFILRYAQIPISLEFVLQPANIFSQFASKYFLEANLGQSHYFSIPVGGVTMELQK